MRYSDIRVALSRAGVLAACGIFAACGGPAAPSTGSGSYAGQWSGTTAQGATIAFTVSADETVTAITVGHSFNGCSSSETFSGLNLPLAATVQCIPAPCPSSLQSPRQLEFASGNPFQGPSVDVHGVFAGPTRVEGSVNFRNYAGCGSAMSVGWSATKR